MGRGRTAFTTTIIQLTQIQEDSWEEQHPQLIQSAQIQKEEQKCQQEKFQPSFKNSKRKFQDFLKQPYEQKVTSYKSTNATTKYQRI